MRTAIALLLASTVWLALDRVGSFVAVAAQPVASSSQNLNLETRHPNGTSLRVTGISFLKDRIAVDLTATNGFRSLVRLCNWADDMVLLDNLGNRYLLSRPQQNPHMKIAAGDTLEGRFMFLGKLAPKATSLMLITNSKTGFTSNQSTSKPLMSINLPVGQGSQAQASSVQSQTKPMGASSVHARQDRTETAAQTVQRASSDRGLSNQNLDLEVRHPNGTVLRVTGVSFAADHITVGLTVSNGSDRSILLNNQKNNVQGRADMTLIDNLGNLYSLLAPAENPHVEVPPGETLSGDFVFANRLAAKATTLTLITGSKTGQPTRADTNKPQIRVELPLDQ